MKSYKVKVIWFKVIKSYEVTALDYSSAKKEFLRLYPKYKHSHIHKIIKL